MIEDKTIAELNEPGPTCLRHMSESYSAFYELKEMHENYYLLEELITGKIFKVNKINDTYEKNAILNDVWYIRLLGPADDSYAFSSPYEYPQDTKKNLTKLTQGVIKIYTDDHPNAPKEKVFSEAHKYSSRWVINYILLGLNPPPAQPIIATSDGEKLNFCKLYMRINSHQGLEEKLNKLFDHDKRQKQWMWGEEKGSKKLEIFQKTLLGTIKIEGTYLIGETLSFERSMKLKEKLIKELSDFVSYEKIDVKDRSAVQMTEEEKKKQEEEQKVLRANPEIREFLSKKMHDYYFKSWIRQKIPMLGGKTPLEAVKTVELLLDGLDAMQKKQPEDDPGSIDINALRKTLGI